MSRQTHTFPSVNDLSAPLVDALLKNAVSLRLNIHTRKCGAILVDAGIDCPGGLEAGRQIAEICLGGLGRVALLPQTHSELAKIAPFAVSVSTAQPVLACLGSQYAGWSLSEDGFFALGSGPARSLYGQEAILQEMGYHDHAERSVIVLETSTMPPDSLLVQIAEKCGIKPSHLTVILTPTTSLAGAVQLAARVLEVAVHKAHALHFPLGDIVDGLATAPVPPPSGDFVTAMGRSNDVILYGGTVQFYVKGAAVAASNLARHLPSNSSRDYGTGFAEIFARYNQDFYQIDPLLFSPAQVFVTALETGETFTSGAINVDIFRELSKNAR